MSEPVAAFWVELAYAAGLLASDGEADERYAATPAYDEWLEWPSAQRWARLAEAWLTATRTPGVIGGRDTKDRTLSALGPGLDRSAAPEVRHRVLALLAVLPEGTSPTVESVLARLHWERPTRGPQQDREGDEDLRTRLARWTLAEAESLGVTGRGRCRPRAGRCWAPPPHRRSRPSRRAPATNSRSTTTTTTTTTRAIPTSITTTTPTPSNPCPRPSRPSPPPPPPGCSPRSCPSRSTTSFSRRT